MNRSFTSFLLVATFAAVTAFATHATAMSPVKGEVLGTDCVLGYQTNQYEVTLWGGEVTTIEMLGNGNSDLDFFVYDAWGRLVIKDIDRTDAAAFLILPASTGKYYIHVENRGARANAFIMHLY